MTKEEIENLADKWYDTHGKISPSIVEKSAFIKGFEYADQVSKEKDAEIEVEKWQNIANDCVNGEVPKLIAENLNLTITLNKVQNTAKATSITQRQHIERLQNELSEKDKELNELKERHKKDVEVAYEVGYNHVGDVIMGIKKITGEQYYKQIFKL